MEELNAFHSPSCKPLAAIAPNTLQECTDPNSDGDLFTACRNLVANLIIADIKVSKALILPEAQFLLSLTTQWPK